MELYETTDLFSTGHNLMEEFEEYGSNRWAKLWEKILDSSIWTADSDYLKVWIYLIVKANYKLHLFFIDGREILIQPGQLITSRLKISSNTGIHQSKVERILKFLKSAQQIEQQNYHRCRVISIINWDKYQKSEQQSEQLPNSKRTANEQLANTYNKDKKDKNGKEDLHSTSTLQLDSPSANESKRKASHDEISQYCASLQLPSSDAEYLFNHWEGCGWRNGKNPIRDWKATIRAWKAAGHMPSQKNGNGITKPYQKTGLVL